MRSPWIRGAGLAVVLASVPLALLGTAGPARADACTSCPVPGEGELASDPTFALDVRTGAFGPVRDTLHVDGGACDVTVTGPVEYEVVSTFLVLRGIGAAWNCPHSKSCDTFTVSVQEGDVIAWSASGEVSAGGSVLGVGLTLKLEGHVSQSRSTAVVTTTSKQICPTWCHVIPWSAFFEIHRLEATVPFTLTRFYAWWTTNPYASDVCRKGEYTMTCSSGTATFEGQGPVAAYWHLKQAPCDATCTTVTVRDLGFLPPLPPGLEPPDVLTPPDAPEPVAPASDEPGPDAPAPGEPPEGLPPTAPAPCEPAEGDAP